MHYNTTPNDVYDAGLAPPRYPLPVNIGRVSLGTDYPGVWFIDDADQDDPVMLWEYDTWSQSWLAPSDRYLTD